MFPGCYREKTSKIGRAVNIVELPGPAWCVGSWAADCVWNISFQTFRYAAPPVLWNPLHQPLWSVRNKRGSGTVEV